MSYTSAGLQSAAVDAQEEYDSRSAERAKYDSKKSIESNRSSAMNKDASGQYKEDHHWIKQTKKDAPEQQKSNKQLHNSPEHFKSPQLQNFHPRSPLQRKNSPTDNLYYDPPTKRSEESLFESETSKKMGSPNNTDFKYIIMFNLS